MSNTRPPEPAADPDPADHRPVEATRSEVAPLRLEPLIPRRQLPHLLVEVDGTPATYGGLLWALREAARREAVVVAVAVLECPSDDPLGGGPRAAARAHSRAHDSVQAVLLRAIAETGVHGRSRCAVMDRPVFDALTAAGRGGDLVLVTAGSKSLLRQAVPRPPVRRLARGA